MLLVRQACVFKVCEAEEVRDDKEGETQRVVCRPDSVVYDCQRHQRLKQVTYASSRAKRADELLGNRLYVTHDGRFSHGP